MTGGMNYQATAKSVQALTYGDTSADQRNPRVVLISSRVPAAEVSQSRLLLIVTRQGTREILELYSHLLGYQQQR